MIASPKIERNDFYMNWDLLDEMELEVMCEDEEELGLFPDFDEEEYLREMQDFVEYMRSLDEEFDKHCEEIEAMEVADAE